MLQTKLGSIWFNKRCPKYSVPFRNFIRSPQRPGQMDEPIRYFAFGICHMLFITIIFNAYTTAFPGSGSHNIWIYDTISLTGKASEYILK